MRPRTWAAVCLLLAAAGCSTSQADHVDVKPPLIATAAACKQGAQEHFAGQPIQLSVAENPGSASEAGNYITSFVNLNKFCLPSGSGNGSGTVLSFTFTPNVSGQLASKIGRPDSRHPGFSREWW